MVCDSNFMLLLLLSHISRVRLCAIPQTADHQAPLSLGPSDKSQECTQAGYESSQETL